MKTYLVTGGAGFIGSNFILYMLRNYTDIRIVNMDCLTYAGNLENLRSIEVIRGIPLNVWTFVMLMRCCAYCVPINLTMW